MIYQLYALNPFVFRSPAPAPAATVVDTSDEQKGRSAMDALLSMFISKVSNSPKSSKSQQANLIELDGAGSAGPSPQTGSPTETSSTTEPTRCRLLCLDGGGIRGLVLVQMLLEIEQISQSPINHLFDWIAGTSTGGILALALGAGKSMKQCLCLYLRMKEQAFIGSRPYASDNLEGLLKDNLGAFSVMTDIVHPKIMVTGVMADRKPVDLHLFRNYTSASDILGIVTPERKLLLLLLLFDEHFLIRQFGYLTHRKSTKTTSKTRRPIDLAGCTCNWCSSIIFQSFRTISGWWSNCQQSNIGRNDRNP